MEYLLKTSAVIVLFYGCYKLLLQHDTFFQSNRWFLLIGLITAVFIPLVVIPIYVEQEPVTLEQFVFAETSPVDSTDKTINVLSILNSLYILGTIVFAIRFAFQLFSLLPLLMKSEKHKTSSYTFIKTTKTISPFSFFNYIVYNPEQFNEAELEQIITHEKVHVHQYHTIDVLLAQLACIVFWFNPFIWLYNKDLKQNLEFIADSTAINYANCKKSYQYTLLKTSMPTHQLALTNNFYNSLIKKRIVMLHKSKSKKINLLKYTLIIPVLAIFLMSFNTKKISIPKELVPTTLNNTKDIPVFNELLGIAPSMSNPTNTLIEKSLSKSINSNIEVIITKDFSDNDFDNLKTKFESEGFTLKIKGIKRNKQDEITAIKIEVSSKSANANYNIDTDSAISPIKISIDEDGKNISIGNGHLKKEHKMVFISEDGTKHKINHSDSDEQVFIVTADDNGTEDIEVKKIIVKDGDTANLVKKHKIRVLHIDSDDEAVFTTKDDQDKKKRKVITVKTDGDNDNLTWTTEDDENIEIKEGEHSGVKIKTLSGKEPLFIIDGKEATSKEMKDIKPEAIDMTYVLKGEKAIEKYGDKGKDGVVIITTKKKD